jgi:cellulose synthase (UDP-forming)
VTRRLLLIRVVVVVTALLGVNYVAWRWLFSVNWSSWWIAVPLVVAETYALVDSLLFGMTVWKARGRGEPPAPPPGRTVDVFITTYNEPVEMVMRTARAAKAIRYPHETWVLDDGDRPEMRTACEAEGIGWITRAAHWKDRPRHAKAGNLNNALLATEGEFLLILDADQVPLPEILDRTLGFFEDEQMALVQTPQWFENVPAHDPLGSQAPLFYGPIQQGKDGWNAAFFCGSNAVIRREALMQLGITGYVGEVEVGVHRALRTARRVVGRARRRLGPDQGDVRAALDAILHDLGRARRELARGEALFDVTYRFQRRVAEVRRTMVEADLTAVREDLAAIAELEGLGSDPDARLATVDTELLDQLASRDWSPLGAIETVQALVDAVDVGRADEAQPIMPLATISVTEDMATCMRLHGLG